MQEQPGESTLTSRLQQRPGENSQSREAVGRILSADPSRQHLTPLLKTRRYQGFDDGKLSELMSTKVALAPDGTGLDLQLDMWGLSKGRVTRWTRFRGETVRCC